MSLTAFDIARLPRILFGPGRIAEVPAQAAAWGRRVLLVTGGRSFFGTGRWEQLLSGLQAQGLEWRYTQVLDEPSPQLVDTPVDAHRDWRPEVVLGIGGGRVLDGFWSGRQNSLP